MGYKDLQQAEQLVERLELEIQEVKKDAAKIQRITHERHFRKEFVTRLDELDLELTGARIALMRLQIIKR